MHFPHRLRNTTFENVVSIGFFGCKNCVELPTALGKLPFLSSVTVSRMDCLHCIHNETYYEELDGGFLHLRHLLIIDLPNLERLSREEENREVFPSLFSLCIRNCSRLTLHPLKSIRELKVFGSKEAMLKSVSNLHTRSSLEIYDNYDLASLPDGMLQNLNSIHMPPD